MMGDSEVKGRVVPGWTELVRPGAILPDPKLKKGVEFLRPPPPPQFWAPGAIAPDGP
jgi:hypothetical protein